MERAQAEVAVDAAPRQLDPGRDERDHVDRVEHAVAGVGRVPGHGANATGTLSASNSRDAEAVGHPGEVVGHPAREGAVGDRVGDLLGVGAEVLEQRADDAVDLRVLARRLGAEVDALEHERAQLRHRAAGLLALDDVAGAVGVLDEVVDERVDPARAGVAEDLDRSERQVGDPDHTGAHARRRCRG